MIAILLASCGRAAFDYEKEIVSQVPDGNFYASSIYNGANPFNVKNSDPYTYFASESGPYQWLFISFNNYFKLEGALIVANQDEMSSGTFEVYFYTGDAYLDTASDRGIAARCPV